ncbi:MAG: flagellar brake domain-containing protein [SAR324 cluster bacterium]|nr:flagellar brake domain-containing protein [SAR324 cluster bacterium]
MITMNRTIFFLDIAINLDLGALKFQQEGSSGNPVFLGIFVALLLAIAVVSGYLYYTRRKRLRKKALLREHARLRLLLSEANLGQAEKELLETLVESEDPTEVVPLLSMRTLFETKVGNFCSKHPDHPAVKRVPKLRQRLGYGFSNPRNPFTSTRMLAPGMKMQCVITHPKRSVRYVTTLLGLGEETFFIRPPTAKGKPVSLSAFPSLNFKVSRENDAEYEFSAKLLGQTGDGIKAVRMEHTSSIHKLLYRDAPRIPVDLPLQFFVIKQEIAAEKRHRVFRRDESQYSMDGRTRDVSLSGLSIIAEQGDHKPVEGDLIVFRLPEAQIKDDLVAEIIDVVALSPKSTQIHLRLSGLKELNRLKLSKFLQIHEERMHGGTQRASSAQ